MSYRQGQDAVRLTLSIRPDDSDLKRLIDEAVAARTADLEKKLRDRERGGGGGGGGGRRRKREPGPHATYAGPQAPWPPHGTLPRQGPATGPGRDWTHGAEDRSATEPPEDPDANPDPGRAWYDPDEGRWVYPDDPTIGFRPSRKGMSAEPAKAYLEKVESRYQPAVGRPPFESPWLSRTHRPYSPGEQSLTSPRGFQQEKINRRGGVRWSQSLREARIRDLQREQGLSYDEALAEVQGEAGGRVGGLYAGVGPTVGIAPRGVMERIRDLERAAKEDEREGRRRKAAAIGAANRFAGSVGSLQGVKGGSAVLDLLEEGGGAGIGALLGARDAIAGGGGLRAAMAAARGGAAAGADQGFVHALTGAIGSTGPVGQAIAAAAVAGPMGKALAEQVLRFMSQKGLDLNRDWRFIIEEQVQALMTHDDLKQRMLGNDAYIITSTDRYVPGSGATTYNSLESRDEIIVGSIGLAERAVGVRYG